MTYSGVIARLGAMLLLIDFTRMIQITRHLNIQIYRRPYLVEAIRIGGTFSLRLNCAASYVNAIIVWPHHAFEDYKQCVLQHICQYMKQYSYFYFTIITCLSLLLMCHITLQKVVLVFNSHTPCFSIRIQQYNSRHTPNMQHTLVTCPMKAVGIIQ